jgi:chromosome segregation ATPase
MVAAPLLGLLLVTAGGIVAAEEPVADAARPIRKVITLLQEMKTQAEKDAADDLEAYDKYMCWCETTKKEKNAAIEAAEQEIADLTTFLEEAAAKEGELKTEIAGLEEDIAADQDALAEATAVREKESAAFQAEEADMKETIALLKEAVAVLEKVQLLQKKGGKHDLKRAETVLLQVRSIVATRFPKFQGVMQRDLFDLLGSMGAASPRMRGSEGAAFEQKATQPNGLVGNAAGAKSYNSRSGSIFGILQEMMEEFQRDLAEAQKKDLAAEEAFQKLRAAKLAEIKAATKQKKQKEQQLADLLYKASKAKENKEKAEAAIEEDQKFLATMEKNCKDEEVAYQERLKVRTLEIKALSETLKILTDDDARELYDKTMSLLQVDASQTSKAAALQRSVEHIAEVARRNGNTALAALAVRMQLDAFTKVKEMMDKMLAQLQKQQAAEYDKNEKCKKDIDVTEDSIKEGEHLKADLSEKHQMLTDTISTLEEEIKGLKADVKAMEISLKSAGEERKAQNKLFQVSVSDQRAVINILNKANKRLKDFYSASLVQVSMHNQQTPGAASSAPPPSPKAAGYAKSAGAGGALQLLATVIKDAEVVEIELTKTEQKSQEDYAAFVQDATNSIEADRSSIESKTGEAAEAKSALSETEGEQLLNQEELDKLNELLKAHHAECDYVMKYFDIRQEARQEEMDAIKDAKAILSGADFGK